MYIVGGAVRDMLLGLEPKDFDYVVTNSTPQEMRDMGYTQVGADFPVFLNSVGEEIALARTERKTGKGYHGFETDFSPDVTLEEDLGRRDLTINSMAMRMGEVVDPYGGVEDLKNKVLRHTSDAFQEDPVRVLRVARFRARLGSDWTVAEETQDLMRKMSKRGDFAHLTAERVWKELSRALTEKHPRLFFDTLKDADCLHTLFPEVYRLGTALESMKWHPEGNAYEHTMLVLTAGAKMQFELTPMLACLVHDFGKVLTPWDKMPSHYGHDINGVPLVEDFCNRLTVPKKMRKAVMYATRYHMYMHKLDTLNPKTFVKMFDDMGTANNPQYVDCLVDIGMADGRGRLGSENECVKYCLDLIWLNEAYRKVKFHNVFPNGKTNPNKIKEGMRQARTKAVAEEKKRLYQ